MTFLSGLFLMALPVIAVPIALHFYHRKQRDTIPWGAMRFLLQDAPRGNWWRDIERYLILLLRCLALAALVFALARPLMKSTLLSSGSANRLVVLVLDDSLSTDFRLKSGQTIFELLKIQAKEIITRLGPGEQLHVWLASAGGRPLTTDPLLMTSAHRDEILARIDKLEPTKGSTRLLDALGAVVSMRIDESIRSGQVFVLSDQQPASWNASAQYRWIQLTQGAAKRQPLLPIKVFSCPVDRDQFVNLSVSRLSSSATTTSSTQPLAFLAEIENAGSEVSQSGTLIWKVDGREQSRSDIEGIEPGESRTQRWVHQLADPGVHVVSCHLEAEDALRLDNAGEIAVEIVDRLPILIVTSDDEEPDQAHEADFVTAALGSTKQDQLNSWESVFAPQLTSASDLAETSLDEYQVVMLLGTSGTLSEEAMSKLRTFVESGGGLWVTLGQQTDVELFNRNFVAGGSGLVPVALKGLKDYGRQTEQTGDVHPPDGNHPAMMLLADTQRLDIDDVQIFREFQFRPGNAAKEYRVLLKSGSGLPMAIESYLGKGRIICLNLPLDEKWSTLPLTKSFVVLVNDWLSYLSSPKGIQYNVLPGQMLVCRHELRGKESTDEAEIVEPREIQVKVAAPSQIETLLTTQLNETNLASSYGLTQLPGTYVITLSTQQPDAGEETSRPLRTYSYVVARDAEESLVGNFSEDEAGQLSGLSGIDWHELSSEGEPSQLASLIVKRLEPVESENSLTPLWTTALVCLLLAFLVELFLSSRASVSRFGIAGRA